MNFNDYLALPDGTMSLYTNGFESLHGPAMIVLQEIFGVNSNIRKTVDRLAGKGYRAVAPDLFWRQRPGVDLNPADAEDRAVAMSLAQAYRESLAAGIADLVALVAKLRVKHSKIGLVGYCLGGRVAFQGWLSLDVDAVVSYYGVGIDTLLGDIPAGRSPLLMHLGAEDPLNPPAVQVAIVAALAGRDEARVDIHPGVGHAFARIDGASYVADAAERADAATFEFLSTHLK